MAFKIIAASDIEIDRDIKRLKSNFEDLTSDLKKLTKKVDKLDDLLKDLNVGTRKFYQMVSPVNSLQRKVERFERLEIEFNRFKETMDEKIKKEITRKERAAGVVGGNYRTAQDFSRYRGLDMEEIARNPNTLPDILRKILEEGKDDIVSRFTALNPNCPPDALAIVLEKGKDDDVSYYASINPNCPLLAKIQWMRMTGRIGKEDPRKHIIEKEEVKEDKDLQKLRDMVKENFSIVSVKKTAQEEWYAKELANPNISPDILRKILEKGKNDSVSWYAAGNPNCPPELLKMVLERGRDDQVSWNAAENLNCPPKALKMVLKRGKDDSVSCYAAFNPNCPPDVLKMVLEKGKSDDVSWHAARNPNCPSDTLKMILKKGRDDSVSECAALNPNCPPELLKMVLEKGKNDDVSQAASENPNCPPLAKIQWMRAIGKIGIEDPTKHIIEKEEIKPDEDLQKLRDLVSFNLKNYRMAKENWYTVEVAKNPNTSPYILRKILEKGKDDLVSWYAAENPNCPPNIIRKILEEGNNDFVSCYASRNPNCPPDALAIVLERGNNDDVSRNASNNPNCPPLAKIQWMRAIGKIGIEDPTKHIIEKEEVKPDKDLQKLRDMVKENFSIGSIKKTSQENWYTYEIANNPTTSPDILRKILEKGKDDDVSWFAALNPNCPPEAKIKWKKATGNKLTGKEKKIEQTMETEVTEPNKPNKLEELKATPEEIRHFVEHYMAKGNQWYKIAQENAPDNTPFDVPDSSSLFLGWHGVSGVYEVEFKAMDRVGDYKYYVFNVGSEKWAKHIAFIASKSVNKAINEAKKLKLSGYILNKDRKFVRDL